MPQNKAELTLDEYELDLANTNPGYARAVEAENRFETICIQIRQELAKLRSGLGIKQADMAATLDMSQSAISHFENGLSDVGIMAICRYADALGVQPIVSFIPSEASFNNPVQLENVMNALNSGRAADAAWHSTADPLEASGGSSDAAWAASVTSAVTKSTSHEVAQAVANRVRWHHEG